MAPIGKHYFGPGFPISEHQQQEVICQGDYGQQLQGVFEELNPGRLHGYFGFAAPESLFDFPAVHIREAHLPSQFFVVYWEVRQ
jgi:hypothetical protein